jgi:hypothetical protein
MGIKALTRIEIGRETDSGTAVAADVLLQAEGMAKDAQERVFVNGGDEFVLPIAYSYLRKEGVEITIEDSPLTTDQIPHILSMAVAGGVTGTQDGAGTAYTYIYPFPTTAAPTAPNTYTLEGGDDQESGECAYTHVRRLGLKWAAGEEWLWNADLFGRQWTDCAFTGTNPSTTLHVLNAAALYLDETTGTPGGTAKANTLMGFELDYPSPWIEKFTGNGEIYFDFLMFVGHKGDKEITGTLTLEHNATGEAELNFARAGTTRLLHVIGTGPAVTTSGTYSKHSLYFSAAIVYTDVPELEDVDGNNTISLPFKVVYSAADATNLAAGITGSAAGGLVVVNELSALP